MEKNSQNKFQIVSFSTNDLYNTPNDILQVYLSSSVHTLLKNSKHALAFTIAFPGDKVRTTIMMCSVLNMSREYNGITEVNCYLMFWDLEKEDTKGKFQEIMNYMNEFCDGEKMIFVFGMSKGDKEGTFKVKEEEICDFLNDLKRKFIFKRMNTNDNKTVNTWIEEVFDYCKVHPLEIKGDGDKDLDQSKSCNIV